MTEIRLLAVPYEVGALRMGVGRGAERLLEAGAEEALRAAGADVKLEVLELEKHDRDRSGASEAKASFDLIELVASRVKQAVEDGAFPVLLSGSCFAGLGVVTGLMEDSPGVVWFDAHADFNTPDSTIEGYFDGMGVAILTGGAWQALVDQAGTTTIPESAVLLAGARDFDPLEQQRLDSSDVQYLPPSRIDSDDAVARAADGLNPAPTGLYLHVDLDVLDSEEARVNIYSAPDGLSAAQLESQVAALLDRCPVRAISLTAYDPEVDAEGRVPPIAMRLLEIVAERLARPAG
ncbi:MAG TPA: arginase family protein [Solirubrobacterales bacterium]